MWRKIANSFTPGCCTCFYNSTVEVLHLHLAVLWNLIHQIGRAPLQAFATPAHWLFVLNQLQLVDIYNSWMSSIGVIPSDGPEREHSLLNFRRGTTRGSLATTKVGIRDFLELFGTRPFPETIAWWKISNDCLKCNGKTLCRSADL